MEFDLKWVNQVSIDHYTKLTHHVNSFNCSKCIFSRFYCCWIVDEKQLYFPSIWCKQTFCEEERCESRWPRFALSVTEWGGWHLPYMGVGIQFDTSKLTDISKYIFYKPQMAYTKWQSDRVVWVDYEGGICHTWEVNTFKLTDISKYTDWLNRSLLPKTVLRIWVRGFNVCWPHDLPAVSAGLKHDTKFWDWSYHLRPQSYHHLRPHYCDHTASTCQVKMSEEQAALPGGQVSNTTVSVRTILKQLKALIILFLSDPGKPGVRSMGRDVPPSHTFSRLNWCDSGWWRYQVNTNW